MEQFLWLGAALALFFALGLGCGWLVWRQDFQRMLKHADSAVHAAGVDKSLGIELLPPIRVSQDVAERLKMEAKAHGLVLQAYVRELLHMQRRGHVPPHPMPPTAEKPNVAGKAPGAAQP